MPKQRALSKEQLGYLVRNGHLSNKELAQTLEVSPANIATYKTRMRKVGINIPKHVRNTVEDEIRAIARS